MLLKSTSSPSSNDIFKPKDEANKRTLYFAYGSNLSLAQMASRCPTSTHHALGVLHGYKWIIGKRGYANVIATSNPPNEVWGMLYWLEPEDEDALDVSEGVPYAYTKHYLPINIKAETVTALVYVDEKRKGEGEIKEEYIHRMNRGISDAVKEGMDEGHVKNVLRKWVREEEKGDEEGEDPFHPDVMEKEGRGVRRGKRRGKGGEEGNESCR